MSQEMDLVSNGQRITEQDLLMRIFNTLQLECVKTVDTLGKQHNHRDA